MELKFEQGLSATRIADRLEIDNPRKVYALIERAVASLRQRFETQRPVLSKRDARPWD